VTALETKPQRRSHPKLRPTGTKLAAA
jgi:hypothetical protein